MQIIFLLLTSLVMDTSTIRIVSTHPKPDTIISEGSNMTISCSSSERWFFCLFNSPTGDKQCAIQESEVNSVCSSDTLLALLGDSRTCSLHISRVTRFMHGGWMCLLNEISQFDSVKTIINVEVGEAAKVGWKTDIQEGILHLMEGEEKEIVCEAVDGYPHMDFVWTSYGAGDRRYNTRNARMFDRQKEDLPDDSSESLVMNRTGKVTYSSVPGLHLYTGSQSLLYRGNLSDNGTTILCRGYQSKADGSVLYYSTAQLQLNVKEIVLSQSTAMEERIGFISAIILALILVLFIFVLVMFLLSRRRKLNEKYSNLMNKSKEELLTPVWLPEHAAPVHVGSVRQFVHGYHELDSVQGLSKHPTGLAHHIKDPTCQHYHHSTKLPQHLLDISLEYQSGDSCEENSRKQSLGGATLSRPTTRTTATISDTSDSSRSSLADKSAMREYQIESYLSFQSDLSDHIRGATDHVYGHDDTIDNDKIFSDACDICDNVVDSLSRQHEEPLSHLVMTGETIFDCELGCFITEEEYQRRQEEKHSL